MGEPNRYDTRGDREGEERKESKAKEMGTASETVDGTKMPWRGAFLGK